MELGITRTTGCTDRTDIGLGHKDMYMKKEGIGIALVLLWLMSLNLVMSLSSDATTWLQTTFGSGESRIGIVFWFVFSVVSLTLLVVVIHWCAPLVDKTFVWVDRLRIDSKSTEETQEKD